MKSPRKKFLRKIPLHSNMEEAKQEFLYYLKFSFPNYFQKKTILDTGAYKQQYIDMFKECSFYSSSISPHAKNGELISYQKKVFQDNTFDMILAMECLENDKYCEDAIVNLYKMLAYDGLLVIGVHPGEQKKLDIQRVNELLHFNTQFCYWHCYKTEEDLLLFIGVKKYILPELPIVPMNYPEYAKENYNKKLVSIKHTITNEN